MKNIFTLLFLLLLISTLLFYYSDITKSIENKKIEKEKSILVGEWAAIDKQGFNINISFLKNGHYSYQYHSIGVSGRVGKYNLEKAGIISLISDTLFINNYLDIYEYNYYLLYKIINNNQLSIIIIDKYTLKDGESNTLINSTYENNVTKLHFTKDTLYEHYYKTNTYYNSPISNLSKFKFTYREKNKSTIEPPIDRYFEFIDNDLYLADSDEWLNFKRANTF